MIICLCHRVSDRDIAREVAHGCGSFEDLQDQTRVATGCGACFEYARDAFVAHTGGGCRNSRGCPGTCCASAAMPCGCAGGPAIAAIAATAPPPRLALNATGG